MPPPDRTGAPPHAPALTRPAEGAETDAAVMRRSVADPTAFAVLYDRHAAALYRFVARRIGRELAEDVVAETFLTAFRRRDRYRHDYDNAAPWLFGIAVNEIRHHRRVENRMFRALAAAPVDPLGFPEAERADERLAAAGAGRTLAAALQRLPRDQREVVLLAAWGELSSEEIARALQIRPATVRTRLYRARRRLRAALPATVRDLVDPTTQEDDHERA